MLKIFLPFITFGDDKSPIVKTFTFWPVLCVVLTTAILTLIGLFLKDATVLIIALIVLGWMLNRSRRADKMFLHAPARRLASATLFSTAVIFIPTLIAVYAPARCAELAPELFLLTFPLLGFFLFLGATLSANTARQEQWETPRMPKEGLYAVAIAAAVLVFVNLGNWTCDPTTPALFFQFGCAIFVSLALSSILEKRNALPNSDSSST